ncbi:MAG: photosynthetic reaction center subunit H [Steroidobacteraceae bacterium]|jgi:photosynthetic reaction center H subunit
MNTGAITGYFDVAQVVLYAFWIFFAGLIIYLRREDKREGYPLESDRPDGDKLQGFPSVPSPKTYILAHGGTAQAPRPYRDSRPIMAKPTGNYPGSPLRPTGNPMLDGVGPASWAQRADHPDLATDGLPLIVPLRLSPATTVASGDPDPRGMAVYGGDGERGGTVRDVWTDRAEPQIRYLEVEVTGGRRVLLPIGYAKFNVTRRCVNVRSILASQFAAVPALKNPDRVTLLEEDKITAYYAGGTLYATAARAEPFI